MRSPRLTFGFAVLLAFVAMLALVHGCQERSKPTEPEVVAAVVTTHSLTILASSGGDGLVSSSPAGINCVVTGGVPVAGCKAQFQSTVTVKLTALPKTGHAFKEWFRDCHGSGACAVSMTADHVVGARFFKGPFVIKISSGTAGVGNGTVKSQVGLTPTINCVISNGTPAATGCSATYPANTALTFTAVPASGQRFSGWGAPCSGTGTCAFTTVQGRTVAASFAPSGPNVVAIEGKWQTTLTAPVVAVHLHQLPTGKVLLFGHRGATYIWDRANPGAALTQAAKTYDFFCGGHAFLADGRLLIAGGTITGSHGRPGAAIFDPSTETWSSIASMAQGRYYPTATTLPDGEILVVSGSDEAGVDVGVPEVFNGTGWRRLTTANLDIPSPFYPAMFVAPNGKVFLAGFPPTTRYLDVNGTGQWTTVAVRKVADRKLGSAVMYAPGKILFAGGGDPPTQSAEVIDLNQPSPAWRIVPGMAFARRQMNATILADGKVLVTNGTDGPGFNDVSNAVHYAELWNPVTESWSRMAREASPRTYHSTAMLLPSGRVLSTGSGEGGGVSFDNSQFSAELFSPPYLFNADGSTAARPTITSAPSKISYGHTFSVQTPDAGTVTRGTLIRLSSVTHAFNMTQVIFPLTLSNGGATTLNAAAPGSGNLAPPGPYMLFLLNGAGVPSVANIVMVGP
ncbi:MAG TPA: galactose oxidase-like domain-containing protein [Gemmatimonadales bacterium]|jgi:hypothetical protein